MFKIKLNKLFLEFVGTVIGAIIIAAGTSFFLLPNKLSTGGFAGIATIAYYLFKIPMGKTILILNVPFFIISIFKLGKEFVAKSLVGTISLSIFIDLFDKFEALTDDKFLACIYGGIAVGLGTAIIFKVNASTGGSDLVSNLLKYYKPTIRLGTAIVMIDTVIVALNVLFLKKIEIGLYSTIAIYLMGKIIDIVFEGVNFTKLLIIVSNKNDDIAKAIGEKISRGTTGVYGKGMYKNEEKIVLICAAARGDVARIKQIAKKIDTNSFIIISNSREVFGEGFKK